MENKKMPISLIIGLSLITIGLILIMIFIMNGDIKLNNNVKNELIINSGYDIDFEKVKIDAASSDVYIKESEDTTTKVKIYGDKEKTIIDTDDNKLNIKTRGVSCIGICTKINTPKVEIYLPKEYSKKINIYVSSGDIKINKFKNANIKLKSSSGDVIVQNAELIDIKGTSGDIQLVKIESAKIDIISGDIKIKSLKKADLTSKSGIIKIENANLEVNSKIKTTSGDVTINKINKINIDTKTTSGNIKIKNNDKESEIKLKVSTVSGDIIIK